MILSICVISPWGGSVVPDGDIMSSRNVCNKTYVLEKKTYIFPGKLLIKEMVFVNDHRIVNFFYVEDDGPIYYYYSCLKFP